MEPTTTTQPRHALRWVLGVGLVFVVVVALALQVAQRRGDNQFDRLREDFSKACTRHARRAQEARDAQGTGFPNSGDFYAGHGWFMPDRRLRGGTLFRSWREVFWVDRVTLSLRQERRFFGSSIEVRIAASFQTVPSEDVVFYSAICAELDVELVVAQ